MTRPLLSHLLDSARMLAGARPLVLLPQALERSAAEARQAVAGQGRRPRTYWIEHTLSDLLDAIEDAEARGEHRWPPADVLQALVVMVWYLAERGPGAGQG